MYFFFLLIHPIHTVDGEAHLRLLCYCDCPLLMQDSYTHVQAIFSVLVICSGSQTCTDDLQVMSLSSCYCSIPQFVESYANLPYTIRRLPVSEALKGSKLKGSTPFLFNLKADLTLGCLLIQDGGHPTSF